MYPENTQPVHESIEKLLNDLPPEKPLPRKFLKGKQGVNKLVEAEKKRFKGRELVGKTLGVVGLGAIGSMVARAALDLGMNVVGYDPALSVDAAWRIPAEVERMQNLPSLFAKADYVTLHVPLLPATEGLINEESFAPSNQGVCY